MAAALEVKPDYLITWNTRHFMKESVLKQVPFPIKIPSEFLEDFRKLVLENS